MIVDDCAEKERNRVSGSFFLKRPSEWHPRAPSMGGYGVPHMGASKGCRTKRKRPFKMFSHYYHILEI